MTLDDVSDIETLRRAAKILEAEVQVLLKQNLKLRRELLKAKGGNARQLSLQLAKLEEQLANKTKALFGDSSEKRPNEKIPKPKPKKQTGHGRRVQAELEVVEVEHVTVVSDESCDLCGGSLSASQGFFEESEEIDIIERKFVIKKHRRQKYKCQCGSCIKIAPGPQKLLSGSRYSVAFAVHVAMSKYMDHMPLERQVKGMKRDGLVIDSQTLWDQINSLARHLEPAWERLKEYVLSQPVIGVDETHWKLMGQKSKTEGGKTKRWQAWAICNPEAVHYSFEDSRSADTAENVLDGFEGTALADGYSVYEAVRKRGGKFKLAHCWAHVRRKYVEIEDHHPGRCTEILDLIGKLYEIEREAKDKPPDEVLKLRRRKSKPIILAINHWALETEALPESSLGRAIKYMGGLWEGLKVFLEDPNVPIDNNATERALRGVVLGRKNHYGSRSVRGTEVAALFYSLIESAKLAGVAPDAYLKTAIKAALQDTKIPLPHELASAAAQTRS